METNPIPTNTRTVQNCCWYAIHTHLKQEKRAENNLRAWNVETFYPKTKERRLNQFSGAATYRIKSLFPRYLFARFSVDQLLHNVRFTRGVQSVVSFGGIPIPVDDEIIELFQLRTDDEGLIQISEQFKPGDKVVMKSGILNNLVGIFEREMNDSDRVVILLATINYQGHVLVERDSIRKVVS